MGSLAPAFQKDLGIPAQQIGTIMGVYMLSSATSGFLGTLYLDRFDRRKLLLFAYGGFIFGTLSCGLSTNAITLLMARALSGTFGGLSIALHRNDLLQMKMSIVDGALGAALFGGLALKKNPQISALIGS